MCSKNFMMKSYDVWDLRLKIMRGEGGVGVIVETRLPMSC